MKVQIEFEIVEKYLHGVTLDRPDLALHEALCKTIHEEDNLEHAWLQTVVADIRLVRDNGRRDNH